MSTPTPNIRAIPYLQNPSTGWYDEQRGTQDNIVAVPSGTYTTSRTQPDQTNVNNRGLIAVLSMTTAGTGSVTLEIDGKDPVAGAYYQILVGTAVTANGIIIYRIYPGLVAVANATVSDVLPRTWRCFVQANNANPATYSVGIILLP